MSSIAGSPVVFRVLLRVVFAFLCAALLLLLSPSLVRGDTPWPGGPITVDTTWTEAGSPYIVNGWVSVSGGVTLTIEPGVTVRMCDGCALRVYGALAAEGTAVKPILFTSQAATPAKGDWHYLLLDGAARGRLAYVTVAYSGGSGGGALEIWSSDVTLRDCTVRESESHGIHLRGSGKTPTFERVRFENNAWAAIRFENPGNRPVLTDLTATGNGRDGIELNGWLEADGIMDGAGAKLPYVVTGDMAMDASRTMTVTAGTTVQFTSGGDFRVYGTLIAEGTAAQPIVWTSAAGTPAKGDWNYLLLYDGSHVRLSHCTVAYGGSGSPYGTIEVWSSDVTLRDCTVRESKSHGIALRGSGKAPTFERVRLENNAWAAILLENPGNKPVLADLTATGNGRDGIQLNGWLEADGVLDGGAAKIPYIVDTRLDVGAARALTITAGTTVQFASSAYMLVDGWLEAQGTAARPIRFTSLAAAPAPGNWDAVWLRAGSRARLAHCEVAYGGYGNTASLVVASTDATVTDCTVRDGKAHGVFLRGAGIRPTLERLSLLRNGWSAVRFEDPGQSPVMVALQAQGNGTDAITTGGTLGASATWDTSRGLLPIQVESMVRAPAGQFLSLAAGTTVRFGPDGYFLVYGSLYAIGSPAQPVILTGMTQAPGAWSGVNVQAGGYALLESVELSYGGRNYNPLLTIAGNAIVSNSRIIGSSNDGVRVNNAQPILAGNTIAGNAFGVRNNTPATTVDARGNWWGHASGPYHASNTPGQGNAVSDGVLFDPWLTAPPAGSAAMAGGVITSLGAPRRASPGGTADYAVFYMNATTSTLASAVLVLILPDFGQFLDATAGGMQWPELNHAFWRLGDLQPGASGMVTARVRFPWGLPQGTRQAAMALMVGADRAIGPIEAGPYLEYAPDAVVSRTELTPTQVDAERAASPGLDAIYRQALADGMTQANAESVTYASGAAATEIGFVAPAAGRLLFLSRQDQTVAGTTYLEGGYALRDATGGITMTLATAEAEAWGAWSQPAAVTAPGAISYRTCVQNCMVRSTTGGFFLRVQSVMGFYQSAPVCFLCRNYPSEAHCKACYNAVKAQMPYGVPEDHPGPRCIESCVDEKDRSRYECTTGGKTRRCFAPGASGLLQQITYQGPYTVFNCQRDPSSGDGIWTQGQSYKCGWNTECGELITGSDVGMQMGLLCGCKEVTKDPPDLATYAAAGSESCPFEETEISAARDPNAKHGPAGDLLPGRPVTYTVEWENVGEGVAYGVYVTDKLSDLFDDATLDLQGNGVYLASARTILWEVGELAPKGQPGSTGQVTFTVTPRAGLPGGTVLTNQAVVFFPSVPERTPTNVVVSVLAPIKARPQQVVTDAGQPVQITLSGEDPAGGALTFAVDTEPLYGALDGEPPLVTYTPITGFSGQDRFTFTASNAITTSRPAEVTILVQPSAAADTQPPHVLWTSPADGATDVYAGAMVLYTDGTGPVYAPALVVAFDEAMDAASLASAVQLQAPGGGLIPLAVLWDGSANRALAGPRQPLAGHTLYTGRVTTAAHDAAGNALAAGHTWTFRTAPSEQPAGTYLPLVLKH